ncbi:hypothetical protein HG530_006698 [Fusarium avenaceum]|nr:hypothetical protein HG530_006698 [Fusarium avenaceum]
MTSQYQHTLFLCIEGFFPKQIAFYLLSKRLCSSVEQLYEGKTNEPNLKVVLVTFTEEGFVSADPENPLPKGTTGSALRLDHAGDDKPVWIREPWSMISYLEEVFPGTNENKYRQMWATDPVERAVSRDIISYVHSSIEQGNTWLSNSAPFTWTYRKIPEEERSIGVGRRARREFEGLFKKLQGVAAENLTKTGWLTPAADGGPGMADCILASTVRHTVVAWSEFILEDEPLGQLRKWYEKFQTVWFWNELEEADRFPDILRQGKGSVHK